MNKEYPINGRGETLVKESEGVEESINPWEIEGEKDGLGESALCGILNVENVLKRMFEHNQECLVEDCHGKEVFKLIMDIRQSFQPLKELNQSLFITAYIMLSLYMLLEGDETRFVKYVSLAAISIVDEIVQED